MHLSELPYTAREMAEMCGVYYLYDDDDYLPGERPMIDITIHKYHKDVLLALIVSCSLIDRMDIVFNFKSKNIRINLLVSSSEGKSIAARVINFMRVRARKAGFQIVTLTAFKDDTPLTLEEFPKKNYPWTGYIAWGKVGFLFLEDNEKIRFLKIVKDFEDYNLKMTLLHHLLATRKGTNYWRKEGFCWEGFFDFTNSTCIDILSDYLQSKGLKYA